ncbi:hypothetical protein [Rhizobium sp. MHM7A]|uniref:hypothetical protein n=1 Tax=Rhizobium sp. MHM7A TaxID=2583233 RepID=UPI001106B4A0|nr:hypothetical protein [Rhizobium sp. MHM7A]TLX17112.1 hypothetical protein FFR93_07315 [Rhizobium sp. MHM7A]
MPMPEIIAPTKDLLMASERPLGLFHRIRELRQEEEDHLHVNRVFSSIQKFGETVIGDALAIFDEVAYPVVKDLQVGNEVRFSDFTLTATSFPGVGSEGLRALVSDPVGKPLFQVKWSEDAQRRSITFQESAPDRPTYPYAEIIASAALMKDERFGIHTIGSGHLDYADYYKTMDILSVVRRELLSKAVTRDTDPDEHNFRRMNLLNFEQVLSLDEGVAGPSCHWTMTQMMNQSLNDVMKASSDRVLKLIPEVERLGVEWGKSFFRFNDESEHLTLVPTDVPWRKALFDLWVDWSFEHQGILAIVDFDESGHPKEATYNLIPRGDGEFNRIVAAVKEGQFVGMPAARYFYKQEDCVVQQEFIEAHGFDVLTSLMRHVYSFVCRHNKEPNESAEVIDDFRKLMQLDKDDDYERDNDEPDALVI